MFKKIPSLVVLTVLLCASCSKAELVYPSNSVSSENEKKVFNVGQKDGFYSMLMVETQEKFVLVYHDGLDKLTLTKDLESNQWTSSLNESTPTDLNYSNGQLTGFSNEESKLLARFVAVSKFHTETADYMKVPMTFEGQELKTVNAMGEFADLPSSINLVEKIQKKETCISASSKYEAAENGVKACLESYGCETSTYVCSDLGAITGSGDLVICFGATC